jgi:predicted secreted protein
MAKPKTASWSKLIISVGDGATPTENFVRQCGLTTKGIAFASDVADVAVPDCDDPDAPAWSERSVSTKNCTVAGDGILATDHREDWDTWFQSGEARNCRIEIDIPLADGGGYYQGAFILTTFTINGNQDAAKMTIEVEMQNDGPVVWTDAIALLAA